MKDMYTLNNITRVKWGVLEENQPISLYPVMYPGWCGILQNTWGILGKKQNSISCIHRKDHGVIFIDHREWNKLGEHALNKIVNSPFWGGTLNKKIIKYSDELVNFTGNKIIRVNLSHKSNKELFKLYKEYNHRHSQLYNHAIIPVYLDLYKPHLTTYIVEYLHKQVRQIKYSLTAKECFSLLTVPQKLSKVQHEEIALLRIADKIRRKSKVVNRKKISLSIVSTMDKHFKRYRYLGYNFEGPAFLSSYFWRRLKELVKDETRPMDKITEISGEKIKGQAIHDKVIKDLKIDKKHQQLIDITRGFIFSKDYRKMSLVQSYYELEPLFKEMSQRLHLTVAELRNCLLTEVELMLVNNKPQPKDLAKRMKGCFFVVIKGRLPGKVYVDRIFTQMKKYLLKKEDFTEINYFHGQTACLGEVRGIVKIINSVKDLGKMKKGDILVSQMTNPDLVPAMKIAGGIVTDLGGVTCHAAIVSRELSVPCVIGTKIATKVLKDGDKVEVRASEGQVKKI